ncbi:hypothetical protein PSECIP111951_04178 [Pseudoalteromonas holothuriae]|uniref:Lipoprotein n=1 Tax=Pseudoalteromonas holothuriae TaxID=2963714 RepID=A0ABM9GNR4_9GAMM|nr:hypothetical protein [Pseudoalteromonas sp. CIP111951]CAH9068515.1 hypothetical protein PSECIP111951_04178 [Pseudoalteromonas sp. CIP111951]
MNSKGLIRLLGLIFVLLTIGCSEQDNKYFDDINKLKVGERAFAFRHHHDALIVDKAFAEFSLDESLITCLAGANLELNPGASDRRLVIFMQDSGVYIQFFLEKKKLKYLKRGFKEEGSNVLQSGGKVYEAKCDLAEWRIVEQLYTL